VLKAKENLRTPHSDLVPPGPDYSTKFTALPHKSQDFSAVIGRAAEIFAAGCPCVAANGIVLGLCGCLRRQLDGFFARTNNGKPKAMLDCSIDLLIVAVGCRPNPAPQKDARWRPLVGAVQEWLFGRKVVMCAQKNWGL